MIRDLILFADFLDGLSNPVYGADTNEGHALGWAKSWGHGSLWDSLNLSELDPEDVTLLTSTAWLWVLENAREGERLPSPEFIDALFDSSVDPVFRLRIADPVLSHPLSEKEHAEVPPQTSLDELPKSWAKQRLMNLLGTEDEVAGLTEMTIILLQVGSVTAVACLRALLRYPDQRDRLSSFVRGIVEANGTSANEWFTEQGL